MKRRPVGARRREARALFACVAALVAVAFLPSAAQASSYNVTVCDDSPGGTQNNSWAAYSNTPEIVTGQNCPASHVQTNFNTGLFVRNHAAPTWITARLVSGWQVVAPAGNSLGAITASYMTGRANRKSTRLNSSHSSVSYAVFCLKKKKSEHQHTKRR